MGLFALIGRRSEATTVTEKFAFFLSLKAPTTRRSYAGIFKEWLDFLEARKSDPAKPTERDVFHYTSAMLQKPGEAPRYSAGDPEPCTHATVLRKVVILRSFYQTFKEFEGGNAL